MGRVAALVPGGAEKQLTFHNRLEYADALVHHRLHEYDDVIAAVVRGMRCMVPVRVLSLFTAGELEEMVCGATTIDTDNLRKFTIYEGGASAAEQHVQYVAVCVCVCVCVGAAGRGY